MSLTAQLSADTRFEEILYRLTAMSERDYYNPYEVFDWPAELPEEQYWMSPELISVHGTEVSRELTEPQLWALSRWESINFYSLNVHGIRELLIEVITRIHTPGFELPSEYFHHLIGEENEHMWFFAKFCLNYGKKIYPDRTMQRSSQQEEADADTFLVFSRLLIFEEIVDHFNKLMGKDDRLHPTVKQVNAIHHQDESRHIAFGRQAIAVLHRDLRSRLSPEKLEALEAYLKRYMAYLMNNLVNPTAYADAGLEDPFGLRRRVLADPAHVRFRTRVLRRSMRHMIKEGIFEDDSLPET
jgi:P-aminobenzoate N-oxygenase AurF